MKALIDLGYSYEGTIEGGDFKLTNFPTIEYALNFAGANQAIIEYIQAVWGRFGVTVTVNGEAWATLQDKVINGAFEASRMGWIADYNDAINFLDMFVGASGNNHTRLGKDVGAYMGDTSVTGDFGTGAYWGLNHNQTWADAYEKLISDIQLDASLTLEQRAAKIQEAETVLLDAGCIMPIYYYTLPYMMSDKLTGVMKLNTGDVLMNYASVVQ
jgi:oligopeptide transport system substrate-binding protein